MTKGTSSRHRLASRTYRSTPYPLLPSQTQEYVEKGADKKALFKASVKQDWEDAVCSVCMDYPHNAVLLLCCSYDKGCRPYMCGTSFRYSNCLNQYKKAYTKIMSPHHGEGPVQDGPWNGPAGNPSSLSNENKEKMELACPLCRGQVKGWTVVKAAREYLNAKKRICMQDNCSFIGTYKELRKHMRAEHPCAQPREVDPILEQKWKNLELEREREDVISTIRSSMPGAMVLGDYVIETGHDQYGFDSDIEDEEMEEDREYEAGTDERHLLNVYLLWQALGPPSNVNFTPFPRRLQRGFRISEGSGRGNDNGSGNVPAFSARAAVSAPSDGEDDSLTIRRIGMRSRRVERRRHQRRGQRDR
ncbi:hypothetical protein ACLOJK_013841 [Asimina triloba]